MSTGDACHEIEADRSYLSPVIVHDLLKPSDIPLALRELAHLCKKRAALLDSSVLTVKKQRTDQDPLPGALPPPSPLSIARRVYPDYTTSSYFEAIRMAWVVKRSTVPHRENLEPGIARIIAAFLLEVSPPSPTICAKAMERRRRLERFEDLLNNPERDEDRREMDLEGHDSMKRVAKLVGKMRHVLQCVTRASLLLLCARQWLEREDQVGLVPRPQNLL